MKLPRQGKDYTGIVYDNSLRNQVVDYLKPSRCYTNVLSEKCITDLVDFMFRKTESWRTSPTGNLFFAGNFISLVEDYVYPMLKDVIDQEDIDWNVVDNVGGNFFHTPHQYGIHTDMPEIENSYSKHVVPYRSILIPLYVLAPVDHVSHMIYYKQRVVDSGCTLDHGPHTSTTHYRSFKDYSKIENVYTLDGPTTINMEEKMSTEEFTKAGLDKAPSPIERYNGLSVENSFEWRPGDIHTFDTCQVHSSTKGIPKFKTKAGLRIMLLTNRNTK